MPINIPRELKSYFTEQDFSSYPIIRIPQHFSDDRGVIFNLAGGKLGDVAVISSKKNSIRANHYHKKDWHICYLISGRAEYFWSEISNKMETKKINVLAGQMIFTPNQIAHKFVFLEDTQFITIAKLNRKKTFYDLDTIKIQLNSF